MNSNYLLNRSFLPVLGALLLTASAAFAASTVTFTDKWKDVGSFDPVAQTWVKPTGSFSAKVSLPLGGVDLSSVDANTHFNISIGEAGSPVAIVDDNLGNAQSFSAAHKTATFDVTDPDTLAKIGTVNLSWTATTISVTVTMSVDLFGEAQNLSGAVPPVTTIDSSQDGVYYEVVVAMDATGSGGGDFEYDNANVPVKGSNAETEFNAPDDSGTYPLEAGSMTGTADTTPPTLSISAPAANFKVYDADPVVHLTGKASDNDALAQIQCIVNGDNQDPIAIDQSDSLPTNSINWTAPVDLGSLGHVGSNIVTVIAYDNSGNHSSVTRTFMWIETNAIAVSVNPSNAGTIKGLKNGQVIQVGNTYAMTATAANKSWIFSGWTDGASNVLSYKASFGFKDVDPNSTALIANFVPNPFNNTNLAATYTGLLFDTNNGLLPADTGYLTMTVTPAGAFSGKVYLAPVSAPFPFSGQLTEAQDGTTAFVETPVKLSKTIWVDLRLVITTETNLSNPHAGAVGGQALFGLDPAGINVLATSEIFAELSRRSTNIATGLYNTMITPPSTNPASAPGGYSFVSATVAKTGPGVTLALRLADASSPAITFSSALDMNGNCPLYASLYTGRGAIVGWLQFDTNGTGTVLESTMSWFKQPAATKNYPNGFGSNPTLSGSLYVPPGPGTNVFGWTNGLFVVDPGYTALSFPDEIDYPIIFNPVKNTFSNTNKVTLNFTKNSGGLSGSFFSPGIKAPSAFSGLTVRNASYGFYARSNQTGPISIPMLVAPTTAPLDDPPKNQ